MPCVGADLTRGIILPWRYLKTLLNGGYMKLSEQVAEMEANLLDKNNRIFALREMLAMFIEYFPDDLEAAGDDEARKLVRKATWLLNNR